MTLWSIKHRLASMSRRAKPDPQFVKALRKELVAKGYIQAPRVHFLRQWWARAVATGSLVVMSLAAATGTYAYASPSVLPSHPLYGVRAKLEKIELDVARTPASKAKVQLKHLYRHVNESRALVQKNNPLALRHAQALLKDLSSVVQPAGVTIEPISDEEEDEQLMAEDIRDMVALEQQTLSDIAEEQEFLLEDEQALMNQVLREHVDRVEERLQSLKQTRRQKG